MSKDTKVKCRILTGRARFSHVFLPKEEAERRAEAGEVRVLEGPDKPDKDVVKPNTCSGSRKDGKPCGASIPADETRCYHHRER